MKRNTRYELLPPLRRILLAVGCDVCTDYGVVGVMNTATTETSIRYERAATELIRSRLAEYPELQAQAIAQHYVAHATLALNLLQLVEAKRNSGNQEGFDEAIAFHVKYLKRNHRLDLGIELEWPNPQ